MSDKHDQSDDQFLQQVQRGLQQGAEQLDEHTRQRLRQARRQALASAESSTTRGFGAWVADLGLHPARRVAAIAVTLLLAVAMVWQLDRSKISTPSDDELMLLSVQDDFDMLEQMEFYEWLTTDDANQG